MYDFFYQVFLILTGFFIGWVLNQLFRLKDKRAFRAGDLRHEVIVIANTLEQDETGSFVLKPRTAQSSEPLLRAFPNPILADQIVKATKKCSTRSINEMFIQLSDPITHDVFLKRVVDIVSELAAEGHVLRMNGWEVQENECYVCATFAADGPHRKIRLDVISRDNLNRFLDQTFVTTLTHHPDEGSHADLAAVFAVCAKKVFRHSTDSRQYVRRVSLPTRKM
jgi:hypothetical protein